MIDDDRLLSDTKKQVVVLVDDLRNVVATDTQAAAHVATEYTRAHAAGRTAFGQSEWAEGLYAQVAVAWVLGCVFVRFCEDNELMDDPLLGGPGIRSQIARDHRAAHLQAHPADDDRHWLREVFGRLRALPATGDIFGPHNPVWADSFMPSADGARKLREELTRVEPDTGELRHDFTDPTWDTRFLGDLYQDLSEHAKKTYALLQTPVFVEEFILDRTLEPAIATFGLADTTIIDPTCGSGHFLLGAFARLFNRWVAMEPATNHRELARRALDAIGGIDLNPFAASIARFRLLLAALSAGGDKRLVDAPAYEIHVAVGDSLLHGDRPGALPGMHLPGEEEALIANHGYESEDVDSVRALLNRAWSAVVGNPPYITVKDPALNTAYRARFSTCHRQYSLGVPFTERFWQLARSDTRELAGYVGMITANSFMKREFGKKLVELWVPLRDITHVVDSSGAHIPGHGIETVILFGRNRAPTTATVRAVLGIKGEPSEPEVPEKGLVWNSILELIDEPGKTNQFVSSVDLVRAILSHHPWTLGGGGASDLKALLDKRGGATLGELVDAVSTIAITREDEAYFAPRRTWARLGVPPERFVSIGYGEAVRDYQVSSRVEALFPYNDDFEPTLTPEDKLLPILWPVKQYLLRRREIGGYQTEIGKTWFEWNRFLKHRYRQNPGIVFAHVAPINHFVFDRGGTVFIRSAPAIKLPPGRAEDDYFALLQILNSSVACFWFHQVMQRKSNDKGRGSGDAERDPRFDHDNTKLQKLPVPAERFGATAHVLTELGDRLSQCSPEELMKREVPTAAALVAAREEHRKIRAMMIAAQERMDWEVYRLYGLVDDDLTTVDEPEPPLSAGERAFEIVLARRVASGEVQSSWFSRTGATPTTELPADWPDSYKSLMERRIEILETVPSIGLIERTDHKRRWPAAPWDEQVHTALRSWLLDRLEDPRYWPTPAALTTIARLTGEVRADQSFIEVAGLYVGTGDVNLAELVGDLVKAEAVPYSAALRYTDAGLRTHAEWKRTWELQRREDAGEDVGVIPAPPKYNAKDFEGAAWYHRGKLDVPKERFISYPGAERETDASMVIGWAGWNHLDRARALAAWYLQARRDGRDAAYVTPLLVGLAELVPWLNQWYDHPNADPALDRPGTQIAALVDTELRSLSLTHHDLAEWRPEKKRAGRVRKAAR